MLGFDLYVHGICVSPERDDSVQLMPRGQTSGFLEDWTSPVTLGTDGTLLYMNDHFGLDPRTNKVVHHTNSETVQRGELCEAG